MFVSTWTLRLTTWSLTQCADGVHREAQQRMFSPDAASGKVSDPQQLNRHKDEALLASVDFRLPFRKKNPAPCLHRPPLIHSHPLTSAPLSPGAPSESSSVSPAVRTHSSRLPFSSFLRAAAPCFACRAQGRTLCCSLLCQHAASAGQRRDRTDGKQSSGPRRVQCGG